MNKVKPRILSGFMELLPSDQVIFNNMRDIIRATYESYGYMPIDTPIIEYSEIILAKAGGETEKQIYRFNKGDNDLSLRFDLTVPLARYVSEHYNELVFPFKRYQIGKVYRGERPQAGRFREFYQCDIDVVSEELPLAYDAEMPVVIYDLFKNLNFGKFTIKLNNRKVLNGFFDSLKLKDKTEVLRIVDKIAKIGEDKVKEEILELGVSEANTNKILEFINIDGSVLEVLNKLKKLGIKNEMFEVGVNELETVTSYMDSFGVDGEYYKIDLTIARGLDYYTGTIYETTLDDYPSLGSVCSGGRYDDLTAYYTASKLSGVGISIGLTRLFYKLKAEGIIGNGPKTLSNILVIPMDEANMNYSLTVATTLRSMGLVVDVYYEDKNFKQKMKYANKVGVEVIAIIGNDEEENNEVTLKNMISGEQETVSLSDLVGSGCGHDCNGECEGHCHE